MGWLLVCFDLPVGEKEEVRQANAFRKLLLKQGYFMLQNSIYVRSCVTYDKTEQHIRNTTNQLPEIQIQKASRRTNRTTNDILVTLC